MSPADILLVLSIFIVGFLVAGALAPFEALGWWAGWYGQELEYQEPRFADTMERMGEPDHYLVYLSGVHSVSGEAYDEREIRFLQQLGEALPDCEIITDIFPYSVTQRSLTGGRLFSRFWRWTLSQKLGGPFMAGFLINLRNMWQVALSADTRYNGIYDHGSAEVILRGLIRHGYRPGSGIPISLMGYSGGGQIGIGAAPYLKASLNAPINVISLGGVMSANPGVLSVDKLYHLYGEQDRVQRISLYMFPGRWPVNPYSAWNKAFEQGIIQLIPIGPQCHTGPGGYLDPDAVVEETGETHLERTVAAISSITEPLCKRAKPRPLPVSSDTHPIPA